MNAQDKAEARAAIERATDMVTVKVDTPSYRSMPSYHKMVETILELTAHLKAAQAENAVLEQQLENFRKAFKEMDYIDNFPGE